MNWFKNIWLTSEERKILNQAKEKKYFGEYTDTEPITVVIEEKPYKNIFYSNENVTVVFKDGTMVSKSNVDYNTYTSIRDSKTKEEIENLITEKPIVKPIEIETKEEKQLIKDNLDIFIGNSDFVVKGDEVCLNGVSLPIPSTVLASFIEILERVDYCKRMYYHDDLPKLFDQLQALKMFWLKLALNSLPQSRLDLLLFIKKNDVKITRNGNLILYRRIVTKENTDTELITFITQEYYKVKSMGADPKMFGVGKFDDDYRSIFLDQPDLPVDQLLGNLQVMYSELPLQDNNNFTAWHDKNVEIKIGGIYGIPDDQINLDNGICAAGGLHAAAVNYNYSGFGDLPVVVLVNPSKAITVPLGETGKLRTTEMFIACVNDKPIGVHFDENTIGAFDEEYHDLTLAQLEDVARTKSFETISVQNNVPEVTLIDINKIKEMLRNRVVKID